MTDSYRKNDLHRKELNEYFPAHVIELKENLTLFAKDGHEKDVKKSEIMRLLTEPKNKNYLPEYIKMWNTIEKHSCIPCDTLWVSIFLERVQKCYELPPYYYLSKKDRVELIDKIKKLSNSLKRTLQAHKLDLQLVALNSAMLNGFYTLENFEESTQERIIENEDNKIHYSRIIDGMSADVCEKIEESTYSGKQAQNHKAVRFIRMLFQHNNEGADYPYSVIKAATFALYGLDYPENQISTLLNGRGK